MSAEHLEDLIAEFVERCESGELLDPEQFASQHPEAGPQLLRALRGLHETESLFPSADNQLPSRIGPFAVLGELGRGGMGRVLQVEHRDRPGQPLALKLLTAASLLNPRAVERLRREGQVLQRLTHPGVVRVGEIGVIESTPFIAMELLSGRSLAQTVAAARSRETVADTRVPLADRLQLAGEGSGPVRAARIVAELARAVAAAHREGLLHRDIKPGNVILRDSGHPVLIDFGLAGGDTGPTLTRTGDLLGTPHYMSPEQARGQSVDVRTDVYGLGTVLYELLTLRPPHPGDDPVVVLESVRSRPVRRVRRIDPEIPRELETIVLRTMAYARERRYPDAEALARDLEAFLDRRRIHASRPGPVERAADLLRFRRRELVTAAMVVLVGAILVLAMRRSSADLAARIRDAETHAAVAWAAGDMTELSAAASRIRELAPDEPAGEVWRAIAAGEDPGGVEDAALEALAAGSRALRDGDERDAIDHLRRAAALAPGSPLPVVMLGMAARAAESYDIAEEELAAAARMLPRSPDVHRELAQVYVARTRFRDAETSLESAVELSPDDPTLWYELGQVRYSVEFQLPEYERDFSDGVSASGRAIELLGDRASDSQLLGHARLLDMTGNYRGAQEIYRRILAENPDSANTHYRLAYSLDSAHEALAAMREYQRVLELRPNDPTALMSLSFFYSGARRWEGCQECIEFFEANPRFQDLEKAAEYALRALRYGRGRLQERLDVLVQVAKRTSSHAAFARQLARLRDDAYDDGDEARAARLSKALWELQQR